MSTNNFITSKQLSDMQIKEPTWYINEILPEGITLVIAKPKVGKSALILYLMIQIALNNKIWDTFETQQVKILYLPYDDPMRRLRDRLHRICEAKNITDLNLLNSLSVYDKERLKKISIDGNVQELFTSFRDAGYKLIIIDTLNQGVKFAHYDSNVYNNDYQNMSMLKEAADRLGLSIIIIHHEKKGEKTDSIDAASGSAGITAAVDTIWRLTDYDIEKCKKLEIKGKDVESNTYKIQMEANTFICTLDKTASPELDAIHLSPEQKEIDEHLKSSDQELSSKDIAYYLNKSQSTVSQILRKLEKKGLAISPHYGKWKSKAK